MEQHNTRRISFEWHSLLRDVIKNIWLLLLAALIAWMAMYIGSRSVYSPQYTSSSTLVVRTKVASADVYSNLSTASDMAEIFTHVFEQPAMGALAAENLGMNGFQGKISARVLSETNMLELSVTADAPEKAFRLLNSVLEIYPNISEAVFTDAVIDVLRTPEIPAGPSNAISTEKQGMIILLAIFLEGGLIVFLSLLRNTVKSEKDFKIKVDSKLLGTVVHNSPVPKLRDRLQGKKHGIIITDAFAGLKFCEDYHKIAAKLEYLQKTKGHKVFSITSVAENEGKSTAAVNVALALTERGYRVALLDMDTRKPAIYKILGKGSKHSVEFSDVLMGKTPISEMKLYRYRRSNLLLALNKTPRSDTTRWIGGQLTQEYLQQLRQRMDFVILDTCPLSVSADGITLGKLSDSMVLVVRTDVVAVEDLNDTILTVTNSGVNLEGCILNDVYKSFDLFGQMGENEQSNYSYHKYRYNSNYGTYHVFSEANLEMSPEEILPRESCSMFEEEDLDSSTSNDLDHV